MTTTETRTREDVRTPTVTPASKTWSSHLISLSRPCCCRHRIQEEVSCSREKYWDFSLVVVVDNTWHFSLYKKPFLIPWDPKGIPFYFKTQRRVWTFWFEITEEAFLCLWKKMKQVLYTQTPGVTVKREPVMMQLPTQLILGSVVAWKSGSPVGSSLVCERQGWGQIKKGGSLMMKRCDSISDTKRDRKSFHNQTKKTGDARGRSDGRIQRSFQRENEWRKRGWNWLKNSIPGKKRDRRCNFKNKRSNIVAATDAAASFTSLLFLFSQNTFEESLWRNSWTKWRNFIAFVRFLWKQEVQSCFKEWGERYWMDRQHHHHQTKRISFCTRSLTGKKSCRKRISCFKTFRTEKQRKRKKRNEPVVTFGQKV